MKPRFPVRETIFGLEDSIVSTLGVVIGIAAGTDNRHIVVLSALVVVIVESLSMSAGTYLSNKSQMEISHQAGQIIRQSISDSFYMGISYILGGFISVSPFFLFHPAQAIIPSIAISVITLYTIGYLKGRIAGINRIKSGLEMSLVSLSAAGLGYLVGKIGSQLLRVNI